MKKGLAIATGLLSLCALCAEEESDWTSDISGSASLNFQTEYAYRGRQNGKMALVPDVWVGYNISDDLQLYAGFDGVFNMKKKFGPDMFDNMSRAQFNASRVGIIINAMQDAAGNPIGTNWLNDVYGHISDTRSDWRYYNRISPYVGITYKTNDMVALDAGYQHNFYTKKLNKYYKLCNRVMCFEGDFKNKILLGGYSKDPKRDSNEIYAGVLMDYSINENINLHPSVYATYGFEDKEINLEGKVLCNFDLSENVAQGLGIDVGATLGFDRAKKFWKQDLKKVAQIFDDGAVPPNVINIDIDPGKKSYWYYGANADLTYKFNDQVKIKAGVEYVGNSAKKGSWVNNVGLAHKNMVWFNAGVDCSF